MAKKEVQMFHTSVVQEGENGPIRGKISVGMSRAMGVKSGDIIAWQVVDGVCVKGSVLSKAEAKAYRKELAPKAKAKAKVTAKSKPAPKTQKEVAPKKKLKRPSGRATAVSYEESPKVLAGKSKPKLKKPKFNVKKW